MLLKWQNRCRESRCDMSSKVYHVVLYQSPVEKIDAKPVTGDYLPSAVKPCSFWIGTRRGILTSETNTDFLMLIAYEYERQSNLRQGAHWSQCRIQHDYFRMKGFVATDEIYNHLQKRVRAIADNKRKCKPGTFYRVTPKHESQQEFVNDPQEFMKFIFQNTGFHFRF